VGERRQSIEADEISRRILLLRGQRVIIDSELARLYGVTTKRLNEAVKRNISRFPCDFMFRLTRVEADAVNRSQFATGSRKHRDPRFPPYAFLEHGAIQAANVLKSPRAIEMGVHVVRAFIRLRELLVSNKAFAQQLDELERKYQRHDKAIAAMLSTLRQLLNPAPPTSRGIGFTADVD